MTSTLEALNSTADLHELRDDDDEIAEDCDEFFGLDLLFQTPTEREPPFVIYAAYDPEDAPLANLLL